MTQGPQGIHKSGGQKQKVEEEGKAEVKDRSQKAKAEGKGRRQWQEHLGIREK